MPKDNKRFINPLLRSSQQESTVSSPEGALTTKDTETETYTSTLSHIEQASEGVIRRKRGAQAFEKTHERMTGWIDKKLKEQFDGLAEDEGVSKTVLLNEAIADLLKKYHR